MPVSLQVVASSLSMFCGLLLIHGTMPEYGKIRDRENPYSEIFYPVSINGSTLKVKFQMRMKDESGTYSTLNVSATEKAVCGTYFLLATFD